MWYIWIILQFHYQEFLCVAVLLHFSKFNLLFYCNLIISVYSCTKYFFKITRSRNWSGFYICTAIINEMRKGCNAFVFYTPLPYKKSSPAFCLLNLPRLRHNRPPPHIVVGAPLLHFVYFAPYRPFPIYIYYLPHVRTTFTNGPPYMICLKILN